MDKNDQIKILAMEMQLIMHVNKLDAMHQILHKIDPKLSEEWARQYEMMNESSLMLKQIKEELSKLEQ